MRLADFILSNLEPILHEWEMFARRIGAGTSPARSPNRTAAEST